MRTALKRTVVVLLAATLVLSVLSGGVAATEVEENQVNINDQDTTALAASFNGGYYPSAGAAVSIADADSDSKQLNIHYEDD
jgi:hypothetical protein